jgi:hypothetical protein
MRWRRIAAVTLLTAVTVSAAGCGGGSGTSIAIPDHTAAPLAHCHIPTVKRRPSAHPSPPPVPTTGTYFGAYSLHGPAFQANYVTSFDQLQQTACRPLDIAHVYLRWNYPFPTESALRLARAGHYLLVSVKGTNIPEMASGQDDASITATGRQLASLPYPIFIEFRWEMDRPNLASVVSSPAAYIAAWDRVRSLFAAAGVTNASWVWCPTASGFATGRAQQYYPGDGEVDWVCADAYPNLTLPYSPAQQLSVLLAPFLRWARQHDKPAMIGEYGVSQSYTPEQRAAWLLDAKTVLSTPPVRAAVYWDANVTSSPILTFDIGSDPTVASAFRSLATDPRFRPRDPADPRGH